MQSFSSSTRGINAGGYSLTAAFTDIGDLTLKHLKVV